MNRAGLQKKGNFSWSSNSPIKSCEWIESSCWHCFRKVERDGTSSVQDANLHWYGLYQQEDFIVVILTTNRSGHFEYKVFSDNRDIQKWDLMGKWGNAPICEGASYVFSKNGSSSSAGLCMHINKCCYIEKICGLYLSEFLRTVQLYLIAGNILIDIEISLFYIMQYMTIICDI